MLRENDFYPRHSPFRDSLFTIRRLHLPRPTSLPTLHLLSSNKKIRRLELSKTDRNSTSPFSLYYYPTITPCEDLHAMNLCTVTSLLLTRDRVTSKERERERDRQTDKQIGGRQKAETFERFEPVSIRGYPLSGIYITVRRGSLPKPCRIPIDSYTPALFRALMPYRFEEA